MTNLVILVISLLMALLSTSNATLISPDKVVLDQTLTSQTNINQFKNNLDAAQEFLINIYKGVYGGISIFWFYYSFWLVLSAFYYSWGVSYLVTKEDAENEIKELEAASQTSNEIKRALQISSININSIFDKLRSIDQRTGGKLSDSCVKRGLCEMRSFITTTPFYNMIPRFIRKMLHLEPGSRQTGTCAEVYNQCSVVSLLSSLIQ